MGRKFSLLERLRKSTNLEQIKEIEATTKEEIVKEETIREGMVREKVVFRVVKVAREEIDILTQ